MICKMKKIDVELLNKYNSCPNEEILSKFGDWTNNVDVLKENFKNAKPFEHIIIPNFLNNDLATKIKDMYPNNLELYYKYNNPIEVKYAYDNVNSLSEDLKSIFYLISTNIITNIFSQITNQNLEYDPYLHGAGLHLHPKNGRLGIHLDYEIHPYSGKQRLLNIILYLNDKWDDEWGGHSELWDKEVKEELLSPIRFNTALVFKTNEISWHGISKKIKCPEDFFRKTLAFYFVSTPESESKKEKIGNDGSGFRKKATFICRPDDQNKEKMKELLEIRPLRLITDEDIKKYWPEWNPIDY